jgi:hypothetical protein
MYRFILFSIGLILFLEWILRVRQEPFENTKEDIGNYMSKYFYYYAISICKKEDFQYPPHKDTLLKYLPTTIPFREDLQQAFQEKGITLEKIKNIHDDYLWECREPWTMNLWNILKPVIQPLLQDAIQKSGLVSEPKNIIHFRCADTPFIKHVSYHLQRYEFFKESLEKVEGKITLMNCSTHRSGKYDQEACSKYITLLSKYLKSLGYSVETQCKTNVEDFADLFQAKRVISTGGSFSFMSGFFGKGIFKTTEHSSCNSPECESIFVRGYNIPHEEVESYHDVDQVYTLLTK